MAVPVLPEGIPAECPHCSHRWTLPEEADVAPGSVHCPRCRRAYSGQPPGRADRPQPKQGRGTRWPTSPSFRTVRPVEKSPARVGGVAVVGMVLFLGFSLAPLDSMNPRSLWAPTGMTPIPLFGCALGFLGSQYALVRPVGSASQGRGRRGGSRGGVIACLCIAGVFPVYVSSAKPSFRYWGYAGLAATGVGFAVSFRLASAGAERAAVVISYR